MSPSRKALRLALVSLLGFAAVYLVFVHAGLGRELDQTALIDRPDRLAISRADVKLFDAGPPALAIVLLGAAAWIARGGRLALALAVAIGVASALALALTRILPQVIADQPSFPSGDATLAMAVACGLVLVAAPAHRRAATAVAASIAIIAGVALVALDWHRPSEVAGGYLLAVAIACAVVPLAASDPGAPARDRPRSAAAIAAAVVTVLFLVVVGVQGLVYVVDHARLGDWLALVGGEAFLAALAVALLAALRQTLN